MQFVCEFFFGPGFYILWHQLLRRTLVLYSIVPRMTRRIPTVQECDAREVS